MSCDAITVHKSRAMGMTEFQHRHLKTSTGFDLGPRLDDKEAWDALLATPLYQSKLAELMQHAHQATTTACAIPAYMRNIEPRAYSRAAEIVMMRRSAEVRLAGVLKQCGLLMESRFDTTFTAQSYGAGAA